MDEVDEVVQVDIHQFEVDEVLVVVVLFLWYNEMWQLVQQQLYWISKDEMVSLDLRKVEVDEVVQVEILCVFIHDLLLDQ